MSLSITADVELTPEDLRRAYLEEAEMRGMTPGSALVAVVTVGAMAAGFMLREPGIGLAVATVVAIIAIAARHRSIRRHADRTFAGLDERHRRLTLTFNDQRIVVEAGGARRELAYSALRGFVETSEAFLLAPERHDRILVPKRAFSPDAVKQIQQWLLAHSRRIRPD